MVTLSFLICPFNLRVCGWVIPVMTASDILGVLSTMSYDMSFWKFFISSFIDSVESDSSYFYTSQVYIFFFYLRSSTYVLGLISLHIIYIFLLLFFGTLNFFFYLQVDWVLFICHFLWSEVHSFLCKPC
jgi:hypothetical protein